MSHHLRTPFLFLLILSGCAGYQTASDPGAASVSTNLAAIDLDQTLSIDPQVRTGTLENGLTYFIRKNHKPENRVVLRLAVNAGSLQEDEDQRGLAHFVEHMAFNGTKHFKANELISYLESIGGRFGADLNAYTSFSETVYILEIPTDKEGLVDKGMLVLSDWAHTLTFDPEEVEKERGVVLEEWRRGQGAQQRLNRVHFPVLLKGSRYADRLPIGKPEVIENAPLERLRDFYEKWYRPDLMAVIAVGDIDPDQMETLIQDYFGDIASPESPSLLKTYDVPRHQDLLVSSASDKEMPYSQIVFYFKQPSKPQGTARAYREGILKGLIGGMLSARLSEITQKPDAPFRFAAGGAGSAFRSLDTFQLFAVYEEGEVQTVLEALLTEIRRIEVHGFTPDELERAKASVLAGLEKAYNEREKTESGSYSGEYVRHFFEDEPIPGIEVEYALAKELLADVDLEDIQTVVDELIHDDNQVILVSEPEKEGLEQTDSAAILAGVEELADLIPEAYEDKTHTGDLIPTPPTPGKVASRREETGLGTTVLTLSNGVEVWVKPTDLKDDEIVFTASAFGGLSLASIEDYPSASFARSLVQEAGLGEFTPTDLQKKLAGKIANAFPTVSTFTHGIRGNTTPRDLETALQLVYLTFTSPNPRPEAFKVSMDRSRTFIKNRTSRPEARYRDTVQLINRSDHFMFQPPTLEGLEKVDRDKAMEFYHHLFTDASDFTFFFVGNIDLETVIPMFELYLGSLPSEPGTPSNFRDPKIRFPLGKITEKVYAGTEPKSQTQITWPALTGLDEYEMFYLRSANSVLQIRLRNLLREELGGTYSVSIRHNGWGPYTDYGTTSVSFGSSPENAQKLTQAVLDAIAEFKESGPTEEEISKVKEQELRGIEEREQSNSYWMGSLNTVRLYDWDPATILNRTARAESITADKLLETIARYYPKDNYTVITLLPEVGTATGGAKSR